VGDCLLPLTINTMTKVIILREQPEKKELKPIEFLHCLNGDKSINYSTRTPPSYKNIELICSGYTNEGFDLMFAYYNNRSEGILYLGNFNDGVVE
jgi:hypothetical protein